MQNPSLGHEVSLEDLEMNYRVITVFHENPKTVDIAGIVSVRCVKDTSRYLVRDRATDISAELTAGGARILDVQPATLRTLYLEFLDDTCDPDEVMTTTV